MSTIPRLRPGDRVALLSASSPVKEERLPLAVEAVRGLGLEPVIYPSGYYENRHGDFAATDEQRAKDLMDAFLDPSIRGILALRGGQGAGRLLPMLDWEAILTHPKYFSGYSDVTALHIPMNNAGLVTWHAIMPATQYYQRVDEYSFERLRCALFGGGPGRLDFPAGWQAQTLCPGAAEGELVGGNLTLVANALGTPWALDVRGKVLFLEDVDETPEGIDRKLTQLRNAGVFDQCAGVVLGYWTRCQGSGERPELSVEEIVEELLGGLRKPVLAHVPCGHELPSMALPLGARVGLDADRQRLEVLS